MELDLSRYRRDLFLSHVQRLDNGCWQWTGHLSEKGYGRFAIGVNKKNMPAHRWMYLYIHGNLVDGMEIDHLCNNKACVNPDHLEEVTPQENQRRAALKRTRPTHCKRGHAFNKENTIIKSNGNWSCRTCKRLSGNFRARERRFMEEYFNGSSSC